MKNLHKKERIELTITCIGVIFLIFLVIRGAQRIQVKKNSMNKTGKAVTSSMSEPVSFKRAEVERSKIEKGWGRDPFFLATANAGNTELGDLIVNGIVWDEKNPYAIINTDVVKVGDKLGNMTVIKITENSVILEENGERHILKLNVF